MCAVGKVKAVVDGGLADLGTGTLRPRLPNERDKEYERNTSAALLLKVRQVWCDWPEPLVASDTL